MRGTTTPLKTGPFSVTFPNTSSVYRIPASGGGGGLSNDLLPWQIGVDVSMTPVDHVNWNTTSFAPAHVYLVKKESSGAQNDEISFEEVLAAGTWTFELIHEQDSDRGIYTVLFNDSSIGTIDGYAALSTPNQRSRITGITVSTSGTVTITLKMATKNASSSSYVGAINHFKLTRTA